MSSLRRFLAATALVVVAASACSFPKSAVPAPDSSTPAPAGVPSSDQSNLSPYPITERLGRWNGSTFQQYVGTADTTPIVSGHVIVMTHGWAVGWLDTYESLQSNSSTLVPFWDPGFTDPTTGQLLAQNFLDLAASLQAADPTAVILMYSWIDQSSTPMSALSAYAPERATEVNGHRMATAIDSLLAPTFTQDGGQVHLIGHSFGANVATTAALALTTPPRQLTLFDSPEENLARFAGAKNDLRYKLPRLNIGRTAGTTFVDNYISEVGEPFHGYPGLEQVVDMRLSPPTSDNGGQRHEFPIGWYASTVESLHSNGQEVGYAWSPLIGADDTTIGSYWTQTPPTSGSTAAAYVQVEGPPPSNVSSQLGLPTTPLTIASGASPVEIADGSVTDIAFTTTSDSLWLTFDLDPGRITPELDLYVDGRERSVMTPPSGGIGRAGLFVILYDVSPGDHTLSIVSNDPTNGHSTPCCPVAPRFSNFAIVSTTNIDRNLTPSQSRTLVRWVIVIAIIVIVLILALLAWIVVVVIRRIRRRVAMHHTDPA